MLAPGSVLASKYRVVRLLGDGGMGSVVEAEHLRLGTRVAIKVLHAPLARKPGLVDRFLREARVSAQIQSPHVVRVTDVDQDIDGRAFLVMELLAGEPLSARLARVRALPPADAVRVAVDMLVGLEAAHALGVVHRDLKPDNVFLVPTPAHGGASPELVKLIDFGIAKLREAERGDAAPGLTVAGMLMGTPEYMAPEQAFHAERVDARADLYSVGAMLYEMLAGRLPVEGPDASALILKAERGEVEPLVRLAPHVPPELAGIVHRAMAPRPELRFDSARAMRAALEPHLAAPGAQPAGAALAGAGGTVMGAPAEAVFGGPPAVAQPRGTQLGDAPVHGGVPLGASGGPPPFGPAAGPPPGVQGPAAYPPAPAPPRARRRPSRWPLVALGLVAAGVAVVAGLQGAGVIDLRLLVEADDPPPALSTAPLAPVVTAETPSATAEVPPTPGTTVPLSPPLGTSPQGTAAPQTAPRPSVVTPPGGTSTAPPPASSTPPPPVIQLPSTFPSTLPIPSMSSFPIPAWPSGLPPFPAPAPTTS